MTVINNVSRKLLADLLGNDHDKRIMAERHLLAMLANAPSPAGERQLSALKAQEPVAEIALSDDGYKIGLLGALRNHRLPIGTKLYAAPVSEAKAQGVVMPERKQYHDYLNLYDKGEAIGHNNALAEVARLNAAPVQQPKCKTCDDNGMIGGPSFYAPDDGGEPCPDCCSPVQQVSVPDERIIPTSAELIQWAWEEEPEETRFQEGYNAAKRWVKMQIEAGIAAPAAPAADAWIPVSERLPNIAQEVIVHSEFDGVCAGVLDSYGEWFAPCSEYKLIRVTSWMPMPTKIEAKP